MNELIIIKTNNGKEVQKILKEKHIDYEVYQGRKKSTKISEKELAQAYQKAYSDKERERECQIWDILETENWND